MSTTIAAQPRRAQGLEAGLREGEAGTTPSTASTATRSAEGAVVLPLSRLLGQERPLRVAGTQGELRFALPVPALWQPQEVVLELQGAVSQALIDSSQMTVEVNGRVVQQLRLSGGQAQLRQSVPIPVGLLKEGYNDIRLGLAQHYTDRCEYPMAPELWTDIDPAASRFVIRAAPRPVPLRLDRLDALFDRLDWREQPTVPVLTVRPPDATTLPALALVAQAIGHRHDYLPTRIAAGRLPPTPEALAGALPPGARVAVAVGTVAELAAWLGPDVPADRGPVAVLRPLPGDPTRAVLLLAATQAADLPVVALALAMPRMPWPDRPVAAIGELQMPPLGSVTGAAISLKPSTNAYPLSALGFRTTTYTGLASQGATLRFWNAAWQGRVQVRIHAGYSAGMSTQSGLNVLANGSLHGSIPLSNPAGGVYDNYAVTLPAGALHPGWNTLELRPVLVPQSNGGDCQPFFPGNLAVTVYDDTTLQTFGGSPMRRPDLALLAQDGRPLPSAPVGLGMAIQLTDNDDATVSAGLTLMAKLTQVFKGPALRTQFQVGEAENAVNRLWVGSLARLPKAVREATGLEADGRLSAPVPLIQSATVPVLEGGQTLSLLRDEINALGGRPTTLTARVQMTQAVAGRAAAASLLLDDEPVTVFTASTPQALDAAMAHLVGFGPWSQLRGGVALWRPGEAQVQTVAEEDAPFVAYSLRGGLGLWVSQYPWWALLILALLLGGLVWLTRQALAVYRRRNRPQEAAQRRDDKLGR